MVVEISDLDAPLIHLGKIVRATGKPHMLFTNGAVHNMDDGAQFCQYIAVTDREIYLRYVCWPDSELVDLIRLLEERYGDD